MKRFIQFWKGFWVGIWKIIKSMANWRGLLSLLIVWLAISGSGLIIIGFIISNAWLYGLGISIYLFWLGPGTPLTAITIALALLIQRYIFRDKSVGLNRIKEAFYEIKKPVKPSRPYNYKKIIKAIEYRNEK